MDEYTQSRRVFEPYIQPATNREEDIINKYKFKGINKFEETTK